MKDIVFFDIKTTAGEDASVVAGALRGEESGTWYGTHSAFPEFAKGAAGYCCHDYLSLREMTELPLPAGAEDGAGRIDTLLLTPLLFPKRPYHRLVKNDRLQSDVPGDPLRNAVQVRALFADLTAAFEALPGELQAVWFSLLKEEPGFAGFFSALSYRLEAEDLPGQIRSVFREHICDNADLQALIRLSPVALAYALALLYVDDHDSVLPRWVGRRYPETEQVLHALRHVPCAPGCSYCQRRLNIHVRLMDYFGVDSFRTFAGQPLQEDAVGAALRGESLLVMLPAGGGKSLTYQLPALMEGDTVHGLTVVISPHRERMQNRVDLLENKGVTDAVAVSAASSAVARRDAVARVSDGVASILYVTPAELCSRTVGYLLEKRSVVRFVIEEAHSLSVQGPAYRAEYAQIGPFLRKLAEKKQLRHPIPVTCVTQTVRAPVIAEIIAYFREQTGLSLQTYMTDTIRENLHTVICGASSDAEKYTQLKTRILEKNCPSIVYAPDTETADRIAAHLRGDGIPAEAVHDALPQEERGKLRDRYLCGEYLVMVVTDAALAGICREDVGLTIHYALPDSVERFLWETGRAARNGVVQADCLLLYDETDADACFRRLHALHADESEPGHILRAAKRLSARTGSVSCSVRELAAAAGEPETAEGIVCTLEAVELLMREGVFRRTEEVPCVYADDLQVAEPVEVDELIEAARHISEEEQRLAKRLIAFLRTRQMDSRRDEGGTEARTDYIADRLGADYTAVSHVVHLLREAGVLRDRAELTVFFRETENGEEALRDLRIRLASGDVRNDTLLRGRGDAGAESAAPERSRAAKHEVDKFSQRAFLADYIIKYLFRQRERGFAEMRTETEGVQTQGRQPEAVYAYDFSVGELLSSFREMTADQPEAFDVSVTDVEKTLLYLAKTDILAVSGGFLVFHHALRFVLPAEKQSQTACAAAYRAMSAHKSARIRAVHLMNRFALRMLREGQDASSFLRSYFRTEEQAFLAACFPEGIQETERSLLPATYTRLFGTLPMPEKQLVLDVTAHYMVAATGAGVDAETLLARRMLALTLLGNSKPCQVLALTRTARAECRLREALYTLYRAGEYHTATFYSYALSLLRETEKTVGNDAVLAGRDALRENTIRRAVERIHTGAAAPSLTELSVLLVDEAQGLTAAEYQMIASLAHRNRSMRILFTGDDDRVVWRYPENGTAESGGPNIPQMSGDARYMKQFLTDTGAVYYELTANARCTGQIVAFTNAVAAAISDRLKQTPGTALRKETGGVWITSYFGRGIVQPMIRDLTRTKETGTRAVIVQTEEEAAQVAVLLRQAGQQAVRLTEMRACTPDRLLELQFFFEMTTTQEQSPVIDQAIWRNAKNHLQSYFSGSSVLPQCIAMLEAFERTHDIRNREAFALFLRESLWTDYCVVPKDAVAVMTVDAASRHEYDHVWMLLRQYDYALNDSKRLLYGAMTTAKESLHIHTSDLFFRRFSGGLFTAQGGNTEDAPAADAFVLAPEDLELSFFAGREAFTKTLRSGETLKLSAENGAFTRMKGDQETVAVLSARGRARIGAYTGRGLRITDIRICFIVAWKKETPGKEAQGTAKEATGTVKPLRDAAAQDTLIVLPEMIMM